MWVTRALGPGAGSAAGWGLILGYVFTGIACVIGFEIYGNNFLSGFGLSSPTNHAVKAILYVVGGVVPALMAVSDIKFSQRLAFILESVSVTIPEAEKQVSILGEKLTVERADGTANYVSTGRPIAVISHVMIEYHPGPPLKQPAPRKR